jgi:hypothetical protein
MSKKLAIKGHETRGKEIIELLEMMGGINKNMLSAHIGDVLNPHVYFLELDSSDNRIVWNYLLGLEWDGRASDMMIFTLEEFLEKYPFKVGDVIKFPNDMAEEIDEMKWDEDLEDIIYTSVSGCTRPCHVNNKTNMEIDCKKCGLHFGSVRCFDKDCPHNTPKSYAVGLKDGKVIECGVNKEVVINEIKPLFKTGDVVKLKGCPDKNLFWIVVDVVEDGYIFNDGEKCPFDDQHHYEKINREVINTSDITAKVADKNHKMGPKSKLPSKYYEDKLEETQSKRDIDKSEFIIKHMILPNKVDDKLEYEIIDGYEFDKVDNNKIILKPIKPKYPTTYAECCEVLVGRKPKPNEISFDKMELCLVDLDNTQSIDFRAPHLFQLNRLFRLLMCLDAYWKIAGEQMGLGKPWEPDWNDESQKYCIRMDRNKIVNCSSSFNNRILAFPTEEMRDAFYENFKNEIEQCKELL